MAAGAVQVPARRVQKIPPQIALTSQLALVQARSGAALIVQVPALFAVQITRGIVPIKLHALEWVQTGAATGALPNHAQSVKKGRRGIAVKKTPALLPVATGVSPHGKAGKAGVLITSARTSRVLLFAEITLVNLTRVKASLIVLLTALWMPRNWMRANAGKWLIKPLVLHGLIAA